MKKTRYLVCALALTVAAWPLTPPFASPRCYPTTRFVVLAGGLVRDTLTQLVWQQQASSTTMTWADAKIYCSSSGFRLPTVKELDSLLDLTVTSSATVNQTAFPSTSADWFWTSSPYAGASGYAWSVSFGSGSTNCYDVGYNFKHVLDVSEHQAFPTAGRAYRVVYELSPTSGQVILVRFRVHAI